MRVLVTGISGFVGRYLAEHLLAEGHEVHGIGRRRDPQLPQGAQYGVFDISDATAIRQHVRSVKPEFIYHLAAQANIPNAVNNAVECYQTNIVGSRNVLEAA